MKTKVVLWGENENEEKVLIGIDLIEADNVVRIYSIPESAATEEFYNQMMNQWRNGQDILMPPDCTVIDRPLTMTDSLLPDELKTDRQDILARAKTEWHFIVLSSKLYNAYADEIQDLKEKVNQLTEYDDRMWEELKAFWAKVQEQVREKNIFREHAGELRARTNELFDRLKNMRQSMNDEYDKLSREHMATFMEKLDGIEKRIEAGLGLHPIFNELRELQQKFKTVKFTRTHHNEVWNRIDTAFKNVKKKKYGDKKDGSPNSGALARLESRYKGLISAIGKMTSSIGRDKQDEAFQLKRINTTDGQLELQLRQAKMAMIQERLASKQVKLDDMLATKVELEKRIESEKKKAQALATKKAEQEKIKKAKEEIKKEIAQEIEANAESFKEDEDKLTKAAETIQAIKAKRAAKAKGEVGSIQADQDPPTTIQNSINAAAIAASDVDDRHSLSDRVADAGKEIKDTLAEGADKLKDLSSDIGEDIQEQVANLKEALPTAEEIKDKSLEIKDTIVDQLANLKDKAEELVTDLPSLDDIQQKGKEVQESISEDLDEIIEDIAASPVGKVVEDVKNAISSKFEAMLHPEEE